MDPPPSDYRLLRFWSDDLPVHQRLAAWRTVLGRKLLRVEIEPLSDQPFQVDASLRALPDFRFGVGLFGPSLSRRTAELVQADNDDVYVLVNLEGPFTVSLAGNDMPLGEGDAIFLSCRQPASFLRPVAGRLLVARFRRAPLADLVSELESCAGRPIRRAVEAVRLLSSALRALDENQGLETEEVRKFVSRQAYDMMALMLNSSRGPLEHHAGGSAAARMRAIRAYIADHLARQDLSVAGVAAAHRVSPRHVQRFFEAEGLTFSEYVLAKRLQHVHAALSDPRQDHRAIGEIALAAGFGDVSHFNRAFRRHYGASPTAVRQSRP
ncbi:MAG TPA: AraC family transcriptional regulator [Rhizomicrobium sp.]|nr:AraC family transcriptional regulator [Rhizomicrobium sp.]